MLGGIVTGYLFGPNLQVSTTIPPPCPHLPQHALATSKLTRAVAGEPLHAKAGNLTSDHAAQYRYVPGGRVVVDEPILGLPWKRRQAPLL